MVDESPRLLRSRDDRGNNLLHKALCYRADLPLFQLLSSAPEVFRLSNGFGYTPLAVACMRSTSHASVEFLLEADPGALAVPDARGKIPLHWACENVCLSPEAVQRLIDAHPEGLTHCNTWDEDSVVSAFARESERPDQEWSTQLARMVRRAPHSVRRVGTGSPLALTCRRRGSTELVRALIPLWPVPLGVASRDHYEGRGAAPLLPLEDLDRTNEYFGTAPLDLVTFIERATRWLLLVAGGVGVPRNRSRRGVRPDPGRLGDSHSGTTPGGGLGVEVHK